MTERAEAKKTDAPQPDDEVEVEDSVKITEVTEEEIEDSKNDTEEITADAEIEVSKITFIFALLRN